MYKKTSIILIIASLAWLFLVLLSLAKVEDVAQALNHKTRLCLNSPTGLVKRYINLSNKKSDIDFCRLLTQFVYNLYAEHVYLRSRKKRTENSEYPLGKDADMKLKNFCYQFLMKYVHGVESQEELCFSADGIEVIKAGKLEGVYVIVIKWTKSDFDNMYIEVNASLIKQLYEFWGNYFSESITDEYREWNKNQLENGGFSLDYMNGEDYEIYNWMYYEKIMN